MNDQARLPGAHPVAIQPPAEAANAPAPIIFADNIPNYGSGPGFVHVTLGVECFCGTSRANAAVAHLRLTVPAAKALVQSLGKALAMLEQPKGSTN